MDVMWLVGTGYVTQLVTLALSVALRRVLGPVGMGFVALTQLAAVYAPFLTLGLAQAAEREIAVEIGRRSERVADALEAVAAWAGALLGAVVAAVALAVATQSTDATAATIAACGVLVLAQQLTVWATIRLRTRLRFRDLGIWTGLGSIVIAGLTLAGAMLGGTSLAVAAAAVGFVVQALILVRFAGAPFPARPDPVAARRLARLAPGLLGVGLTTVALNSVDQLAVAAFLGSSALGLYSAAYLGNAFLLRVPNLVGSVIYPRLQRDIGEHADPARVYAIVRRTTEATILAIAPLTALLFVGLPALVRVVIPAFEPAIPAMRLLLVGVGGLALALPASQLLVTLDRQWRQVALTAATAGLMATAYGAAHVGGVMSIDVAAAVDVGAYGVYGVAVQVAAARAAGGSVGWLRGAVPGLVGPAAALLVAAAVADRLWPGTDFGSLVAHAGLEVACFGAVWSLLAARRLRREPAVAGDARTIAEQFLGRLRRRRE